MEGLSRPLVFFLVLPLLVLALARLARRRTLRHPPGPPGYPFVGYLKPIGSPVWKTFYLWSIDYGSPIIRFNVLGTNMVVLNSLQSATDLLEKKSSIYSDRAVSGMVMLRELVGFDWSVAAAPYGPHWRAARRAMQQSFNQKAVASYRPTQKKAVHRLLLNLRQTPLLFQRHTRFLFASLAIEVAYGLEVHSEDDSLIATAEHAMWAANQCMTPGAYLVDSIKILRYVPAWLPGAKFKRQAREWRKAVDDMVNVPYDAVKNRTDLPECAAKKMLAQKVVGESFAGASNVVRDSLGTIFGAAADTSTTALDSFFLAMTLYPDVQKAAQASIDRVCRGRLPAFADMGSLPYVDALVKECLRCYTVAPYGIPHMVTTDDVYAGYCIPAKSVIFPNIWAILHDPAAYPDPDRFNPDRFLRRRDGELELEPDVLDPAVAAFGFGRRICPGRHLAYESLWLAVASVLAVFDVAKAVDDRGRPVTPSGEASDTFISLKEFRCSIAPRSAAHEALVAPLGDV